MRAGALRHTVAADEQISVSDGEGGQVVAWVQRLTFKASIEPITGREQMRSNQLIADVDSRISLRWSAAANEIKASWRLRHGAQIYDIAQPPIEKRLAKAELEILARTGRRCYQDETPVAEGVPEGAIMFGGELLYLNEDALLLLDN
jgi:SPP1 family predicted phage head-tail adaptor